MKNIIFLSLALIVGLSSCNSGNDSDIRAAAKESLENKTVIEPGSTGMLTSQAGENNVSGPITSIEFESKKHTFSDAVSGDKIEAVFKFKNTGNEPLIISDVKTSCGCTASNYPREPVAPGESAEIEAVFDTAGKTGAQTKNVTVMTNTNPSSNVLIIEGTVDKKDNNS